MNDKAHNRLDDINMISDAVDAFAKRMKARMTEKYDAGYRGWDTSHPEGSLIFEIQVDAADLKGVEGKHVDIANRAMMLDYRKHSKGHITGHVKPS